VTRSLPHFCEILHPEGGKHRALAWLCGRLGIEEHETIAFGDGYNDVDMLRWAGLGVAVGDAVAEALQAADRIAPPMEEDGAAQVLEDLLGRGLVG
jgi:hydroxymethylpyrimidine pyrophosphatase-like HAD family hydrolase